MPTSAKNALTESLETLGLDKEFEKRYKACQTREEFDGCEKLIKKSYRQQSLKHHPDKLKADSHERIQKINDAYTHLKRVNEEATTVSGELSSSAFDMQKFSSEIRRLESINFKGDHLPQSTQSTAPTSFDSAQNYSRPTPTSFGSAQNYYRPAPTFFGSPHNYSRPTSAHFSQARLSIFFIRGVGVIFFASDLPSQKPSPSINPEFSFNFKNRSDFYEMPYQHTNRYSFNAGYDFKNHKPESSEFFINSGSVNGKNGNYFNSKSPFGRQKNLSFRDLLRDQKNYSNNSRDWSRV